MRFSLLPTALLLLILPGVAVRADSRHGPPPATAADLTPLRDAVAALANGPVRDLNDSLGKTNTRLDVLDEEVKRIDHSLAGVDLARIGRDEAAAKSAMGDHVRREDSLEEQERAAEAHLGEAAATASRQGQDLLRQLAGAENLLASLREQNRQWHEAWPKELAANSAAAATAQKSLAEDASRSLWLATAALGLLFAAGALWLGWGRRARQREVLLALTRLGAELRSVRPAVPTVRLSPSETEWQRLEGRLRRLAERCESALRTEAVSLAPGLPETAETAPPEATSEQATVAAGVLSEPTIASRLLWPPEFLDPKSPLSRWRFLLESHFDDPEYPALPVLAALLGLRVALDRSAASSAEVASAAFRLSEAEEIDRARSLADTVFASGRGSSTTTDPSPAPAAAAEASGAGGTRG